MTDLDKTMAPRQGTVSSGADDVTMPGKRDRKPDGRFAVGDLIMGRYKVLAELGQGGMGVVYRCLDETAGVEVALKALPPELSHNSFEMEDIRDNFQLVVKLVHQNIAISKNLEKDPVNGNCYLIMEYVEGEDLRCWIKRRRKENSLSINDILPVIKQIAEALDYAHEQKIIHRDIKPGNIMITQAGRIKVLDFGLAAQIHSSMSRLSQAYRGISGTGPYMAPEQWRGRVQGAPADQYALAVLTYEMLAGCLPFENPDTAILQQAVLNLDPGEISGVPGYVNGAIRRAMSKEPGDRFASCAEFIEALSGRAARNSSSVTKNLLKWMLPAVVALLLVTAVTGYYRWEKSRHQQEQRRLEELIQQRREKISALESAARSARERNEWQKVLKLSSEILALEEDNKEALNLQKIAGEQIEAAKNIAGIERQQAFEAEVYNLRKKVQAHNVEFERAGYDRGQTFGKHLDAFTKNFRAGESAWKNNEFEAARTSYNAALQSAGWIIENIPLRQRVQKLQQQLMQQKRDLDKFDCNKFAAAQYKAANDRIAAAVGQYDAGEFTTALAGLSKASMELQKAGMDARQAALAKLNSDIAAAQKEKQWDKLKEISGVLRSFDSVRADELVSLSEHRRKQEKLDKALAAARQARDEKNYREMYKCASEALDIDSGCRVAQDLQQEAMTNLPPELRIVTTVEGQKVPAGVEIDQNRFNAGETFTALKKMQKYRCRITGLNNYSDYSCEYEFICNWGGLKELNLELEHWKKAIDQDRKRGIKFSADGRVLEEIPDGIVHYTIPDGVQKIQRDAFRGCNKLVSVTIPDSVVEIGEAAFYGCISLTSINIGNNVNSLGNWAFYNCTSLTRAVVGDKVKSIGDWTFYNCVKLTEVQLGGSIGVIGKYAFGSSGLSGITIPGSVKIIGERAFHNCKSLSSIMIPAGVTSIGEGAFYDCSNLNAAVIGDNVISIGDAAFYNCSKLSDLTLGRQLRSIGRHAFAQCGKLTGVQLPDGIEHLGKWSFTGCSALTNIVIPASVKSIDSAVFENAGCAEQVRRDYPGLYKTEIFFMKNGRIPGVL